MLSCFDVVESHGALREVELFGSRASKVVHLLVSAGLLAHQRMSTLMTRNVARWEFLQILPVAAVVETKTRTDYPEVA